MIGRCALAGLALTTAFAAAYAAIAATVGFHGPRAAWEAYGEVPVGPPIEQPICFWTDLGFVLSGLLVLARLDRAPPGAAAAHPLRGPTPYSVALGLVIVWMGPASMLEHGTLTGTWGWFDAASIHWLGLYVTGWCVLRAVPGGTSRPGVFFAAQAVLWAAVGVWTWVSPSGRDLATVGALAIMTAVVLASAVRGGEPGRWRWLGAAALAFAAAIACLVLGAKGGPLAPWGHGAWHLGSAAGTYLLYRLLAEL